MRKLRKFLSLALFLVLAITCCPVALAGQPDGYWPYVKAYNEAVASGNEEEILKAGDAVLEFYADKTYNKDIAAMSFVIYRDRLQMQLYEKRGDYNAAVENAKQYLKTSQYLGSTDNVSMAEYSIRKLDPHTEVYALTTSLEHYPQYGAMYEPTGTYVGRVQMEENEDLVLSSEAMISVYVDPERGESAATFDWIIDNFDDGNHVVQIPFNYTYEGKTAQNIVDGKCDTVINDTLTYLAKLKCPVLLRIGGEMNLWQMDPTLFKQSYVYVAEKARQIAPNVALVFSPGYVSSWGDTMTNYYPGDEYVDWVGMSLYMNHHNEENNLYFGYGDFCDAILNAEEVVKTFGDRKPILVSEGGALVTDGDFAVEQVTKMYQVLNMVYPQIKAIVYFDRHAPESDNVYTLDANSDILSAYNTSLQTNKTLLKRAGDSADLVYTKLSDYRDKRPVLELSAYSNTVYSDHMTVTYTLNGKTIATLKALPYSCSVDVSTLRSGANTLTVSFDDEAGYREEKTYTLTKELDGTVTTGESEQPADWAMEEVQEAYSLGLLSADFLSRYTEKITRQEFCQLVIDMIEVKSGSTIDAFLASKGVSPDTGAFTDTSDKAVLAANALGIVNGKGAGRFDPDASITREQAAKMLTIAANTLGMTEPTHDPKSFSDSPASWAVEYVAFISGVRDKVSGKEVMGGDGGRFNPVGTFTRQQAYLTILRLFRAM